MKDSLESDMTTFQRKNSIMLYRKHQGARNSPNPIAAQAHLGIKLQVLECYRMLTTWSYAVWEYPMYIS